jgi:tRNA(Ile)-lysidine synthase TilS/MesJ
MPEERARGLCLLSGGLDSTLAICVLRAQGLHVEAVAFDSPFFHTVNAQRAAAGLDVPLHVADFTADIVALLRDPPHGFGGGMNPCIDCHARMLRRAGEKMTAMGFDFLATGEVLNQRPMSQTRHSLEIVARESGYADRIVRPLCAQRLDPSGPERSGLVDRSRLLGLHGRSRQPQMELAKQYGLREYATPAGGCLLTEPGFCRRLRDLADHEGLDDLRLLRLLRLGRHLRLPGGARCLVGRNRDENEQLAAAAGPDDVLLRTANVPGPTVLLPGGASAADVECARGVCASYGDRRSDAATLVRVTRPGASEEAPAEPLARADFAAWIR